MSYQEFPFDVLTKSRKSSSRQSIYEQPQFDMLQDTAQIELRIKLEQMIENEAPIVELTIQSSATLTKGAKILINALGLASH